MTAANRITGMNLHVTFAAGTISGDFTSFGWDNPEDLVDLTAGADAVHYHVPTRSDFTATLDSFFDGSTLTVWDTMAPGAVGTLIVSPSGTAAGNDKLTCTRAIVSGRNATAPFDGGFVYTVSFQGSAAITETVW